LFSPTALDGGGLKFTWRSLSLDKPESASQEHWLLCEHIRQSLVPPIPRGSALPNMRLFCGTSTAFIFGRKETTIALSAKKLTRSNGDWYPNFSAFLVREYQGYSHIVDLNDDTGLPRQIQAQTQVVWTVPKCLSGENLKILVYVIADAADFPSIEHLTADQLLTIDLK